jgi:hypothetical protein
VSKIEENSQNNLWESFTPAKIPRYRVYILRSVSGKFGSLVGAGLSVKALQSKSF